MASPKLNLVVAMCNNKGIGIDGKLPWRIKGDMAFFKRITSESNNEGKQNAVVMGRKTWESIPKKFRPLPNRVNVVISRTMSSAPEGVYLATGLDDAVSQLSGSLSSSVSDIFVIGGASIYKMALESPYCHRVYLTRVLADVKCDTFMPDLCLDAFKLITCPDIDGTVQKEGDFEYKFEVYEKKALDDTGDLDIERRVDGNEIQKPMDLVTTFNICVAVEESGGIGYQGGLPWPSIKKDCKHYLWLTSKRKDPNKKVLNIKGRATYEDSVVSTELNRAGVLTVVVSNTLKHCPEHAYAVVPSIEAGMELARTPPLAGQIESVWIMGGQATYQEALKSQHCHRVYLTQIFAPYKSDRFFPDFKTSGEYEEIRDPEIDGNVQEENGIRFQFQVYQRVTTTS